MRKICLCFLICINFLKLEIFAQEQSELIPMGIEITDKLISSQMSSGVKYYQGDIKNSSKNKIVEACDLSGIRAKNIIVDIGYDSKKINREYYSHSNEYSQVDWIYAKKLILQNENQEKTYDGRYCKDEAKVPGVEDSNLDEGHIIADSLGGVSNAYNITPEDSELNRNGVQREMEQYISDQLYNGRNVTDVYAHINYKDNVTMIPSDYYFQFKVDGKLKEYYFKNNSEKEGVIKWILNWIKK